MSRNNYADLVQRFGNKNVKWVPERILNLPNEGWFVLQITPCPPSDEIEKVVSDIYHNRIISVSNGRVRHSDNCTPGSHDLPRELRKIFEDIKEETFVIAIYPGLDGLMLGQPIAIPLSKPINYEEYPSHPHINLGGFIRFNKSIYTTFLPESICYGFNQNEYSKDEEEKLYEVFAQITIWLFRHQVWCVTREKTGRGIWIGPQEGYIQPEYFVDILNPFGECRCGNHKSYADCHMPMDYSKAKKCSLKEASDFINKNIFLLVAQWKNTILANQKRRIELLSSKLM
jgi:hypothetical protein